jgi:hypothetical protein
MYFPTYQYEELSSSRFRYEFSDGPMNVYPPSCSNIQAVPNLPKVACSYYTACHIHRLLRDNPKSHIFISLGKDKLRGHAEFVWQLVALSSLPLYWHDVSEARNATDWLSCHYETEGSLSITDVSCRSHKLFWNFVQNYKLKFLWFTVHRSRTVSYIHVVW